MEPQVKVIPYNVLYKAVTSKDPRVSEVASLDCMDKSDCVEIVITEPCILYFNTSEWGSVYKATKSILDK